MQLRLIRNLSNSFDQKSAKISELIVLVDFKAIYPRVPQGIFAGFPGVVHFLSFEEICQYPRARLGKVSLKFNVFKA
jgi:hypothetical protein